MIDLGYLPKAPAGFIPSNLEEEHELCTTSDRAFACSLFFSKGQPTIRLVGGHRYSLRQSYYLSNFILSAAKGQDFFVQMLEDDAPDVIFLSDVQAIVQSALAILDKRGQLDIRFFEWDPELPF